MAIKIDTKHFDLIKAYGEEAYPDECCGFLLGKQHNHDKEVVTTLPARNSSHENEKYHRFVIRPEEFIQAEKFAREHGLDVVGFYHSHPNAEARPSQYDLEHSWPWYSYVIVSVKKKKAGEISSWSLQDDRGAFVYEDIQIVELSETIDSSKT